MTNGIIASYLTTILYLNKTINYLSIYKLIKKSLNNEYKIILMSYFFLEFIYSSAHNNFLLNSILLWSLLSLNFIDKDDLVQC